MSASPPKARYVMIGGFLGAGKTTAISRLAETLTRSGRRVGLIANDQSRGLADTALLRSRGFRTEEITGGCFCCRFDSLVEATERLAAADRPDVYIAEPVGSCTDLVATVADPLRRLHGDRFTIAPLSVLVDPVRAGRILGVTDGPSFSPKVIYVYLKQLEEADLIIINKCDSVGEPQRARLVDALERRFPRAERLCCSARDGQGCDLWFERLLTSEHGSPPAMTVDYDAYAEGEAALGWLNARARLAADPPCDGSELLIDLTRALQARLQARAIAIAHLKSTLTSGSGRGGLSAVNLVDALAEPVVCARALDLVRSPAVLTVNLRAEGDPEILRTVVRAVLEDARQKGSGGARKIEIELQELESFRPSRPIPQHRVRR